jgi:hypothetical protein
VAEATFVSAEVKLMQRDDGKGRLVYAENA